MGRKVAYKNNCGRKFITIEDQGIWDQILEFVKIERYKNSFNALINDVLLVGLPILHQKVFDKVQIDGKATEVSIEKQYGVDQFYFQIIRLMREIIANQVVMKAMISSVYNYLTDYTDGSKLSELLKRGLYRDTPDCFVREEARLLKESSR